MQRILNWYTLAICEQRQLFVTKSCMHLSQMLEEFAATMCHRRGGSESLRKAIDAASACKAQYDSSMQVSGVFSKLHCDAVGKAIYFCTSGPTQLAYGDREIFGHGVEHHPLGFGTPVGQLKNFSRCMSQYTINELKAHKIVREKGVELEYLSGSILDSPHCGTYVMAVGSGIVCLYGGVADREKRQLHKPTPTIPTPPAEADTNLMKVYVDLENISTLESNARYRAVNALY